MGDSQKVVISSLYGTVVARARGRETRDRMIEHITDATTVVYIFLQKRTQFARRIRL